MRIDGVHVRGLDYRVDDRGYLLEIVRSDDPGFTEFGQAYVTACYPGVVKAWHCHELQTDRLCALSGMMKVALWDGRPSSPTRGSLDVLVIGERAPHVITVPPGVWHGFTALGPQTALMLNVCDKVYCRERPDELRKDPDDAEIGYSWQVVSR